MTRTQEHLDKMLDVKKQIYMTRSWKRKNDLSKYLKRLEKEWATYQHLTSK